MEFCKIKLKANQKHSCSRKGGFGEDFLIFNKWNQRTMIYSNRMKNLYFFYLTWIINKMNNAWKCHGFLIKILLFLVHIMIKWFTFQNILRLENSTNAPILPHNCIKLSKKPDEFEDFYHLLYILDRFLGLQ